MDSQECDRSTGSSLKRRLRSGPWETEEGEGMGLVTDEVILRLVELFMLKDWVGGLDCSTLSTNTQRRGQCSQVRSEQTQPLPRSYPVWEGRTVLSG